MLAKIQDEKPNDGDSDEEGVGSNLDFFTAGMLEENHFLEENAAITFDKVFFGVPPQLDLSLITRKLGR